MFLAPEEFDKRYKGLSVQTEKSFYGGRSSHTVVIAKKDFYSCHDLLSLYGSLQIDKTVLAKYPLLEKDLLASKPYKDIFSKNATKNFIVFKPSAPKLVKPFLIKTERIKDECEANDPCIYAYLKKPFDFKTEADILNVCIEVSKDCGIQKLEKQYENIISKPGGIETKALSRVIFTFQTAKTAGEYQICLLERSTGFTKLLLKYLEASFALMF